MARKATFAVVIVAIAALVAWKFGLLGPVGSTADGPLLENEMPGLADAAEATGSAMAPTAAALESGGKKPVAKSKAPTVDGPRITGKVTDRAGTGIPDARVVSIPDSSKEPFRLEQIGSEGCPGADAITDAEGKFVVSVSNEAPFHALVAIAEGYGVSLEASARAGSDVTLVLDRSASMSGHVTDAEGTGIAGAKVVVHLVFDALMMDREATSGAGGAFRIEGVPSGPRAFSSWKPGIYSAVEVTAEGYAPLLATGIAALAPGKDTIRDFVLGRGATVVGKVVDADSGDPIEGARVLLWSQEGEMGRYARGSGIQLQVPWTPRALGETSSSKDGTFQLERVPAQGFHPLLSMNYGRRGPTLGSVGAAKEGFCGAAEEVPFAREGARTEVTLKLWPAAVVEGRVVDATGKPVEKAIVDASIKERPVTAWFPKKLFGEAAAPWGGYEGLGADGKYRLSGVPVPNNGSTDVKVRGRWPQKAGYWSSKEDGDGSVTVTVAARMTVTAPDIVLKPSDLQAPGNAKIVESAVKVVAVGGAPVWGANLLLNWNAQGVTDREGKAVLSWIPGNGPQGASRSLTVRAKGFATTTTSLEAATGTEPFLVTMQAAHRLSGRVVGPDGAPVLGAWVTVGNGNLLFDEVFPDPRPRGNNVATPATTSRGAPSPNAIYAGANTDGEGRFVAEDLPEGPYHLVAYRSQRGNQPQGAMPPPRGVLPSVATEAPDVVISMPSDPNPPTGALEGTVVDSATGRPVPGLTVTLRRGDEIGGTAGNGAGGMASNFGGTSVGQPSIPSPGRYEFPYAAIGAWSVVAVGEGYAPKALEGLVIRAGETTKAPVLRLDHGVTVKGHFVAPDGLSLADRILYFSNVEAEPGKERWVSTTLTADGNYSLAGFTPGDWRIACHKQGYESKPEPVLLAARDEKVRVREADTEVRFDISLVASGMLCVQPVDDRLPPPDWEGGQATDAQKAFGDGCRVVVKGADGTVIAEQRGKITRGSAGKASWLNVIPGRYTARLEMPGDEVREQTIDVAAGAQNSPATVTFAKK